MQTLPLLTRRISRGIHAYSVKRLCWFLTPPRLQKLVRWPNITLSPTPCASLADINVHAICPSVCVSWVVKIKLASRCDGRAHCLVLSCIPGGRHIHRRLLFCTCQVSPYHGCSKLQDFTPGLVAACSPALASLHVFPLAAPHNRYDRS